MERGGNNIQLPRVMQPAAHPMAKLQKHHDNMFVIVSDPEGFPSKNTTDHRILFVLFSEEEQTDRQATLLIPFF